MIYPDWFSNNITTFNKFLGNLSGKSGLYFLQIGAYTGDASKWLLDNILTSKDSFLVDVDTWSGSEELAHKEFDWNDVELVYDKKMSSYNNVIKEKTTSSLYLKQCNNKFDFIYIDGDHTSSGVYSDAVLSFPFLKNGGIMAFDDYLWHHDTKISELEPKNGIDTFLNEQKAHVELLHHSYQVWIKKL